MTDYFYEFTNKIALSDLEILFAQTDWTWRRSAIGLQTMLNHSPVCLVVWDGNKLIGFVRAVTDDVYRAYVEDMIVDREYRGEGIGSEMMRRLLERLEHVEEITLNCDLKLTDFYRQFGFTRFTMPHMHIWKGEG